MAQSLHGVDDSDLDAYLTHMRRATVYTTTQAPGTIMRTTPRQRERPLPYSRSRPQTTPPTIEVFFVLDADYLAAHPYTP